jgi:hypothetical protein
LLHIRRHSDHGAVALPRVFPTFGFQILTEAGSSRTILP